MIGTTALHPIPCCSHTRSYRVHAPAPHRKGGHSPQLRPCTSPYSLWGPRDSRDCLEQVLVAPTTVTPPTYQYTSPLCSPGPPLSQNWVGTKAFSRHQLTDTAEQTDELADLLKTRKLQPGSPAAPHSRFRASWVKQSSLTSTIFTKTISIRVRGVKGKSSSWLGPAAGCGRLGCWPGRPGPPGPSGPVSLLFLV